MTNSDSDLIDDLLDRWEESQEDGKPLAPEELCRDTPHLLPKLKQQIERLTKLDNVLDQPTGDWVDDSSPGPPVAHVDVQATFGKFQLIDQGGLGYVYEALDDELNREAAVKFLQPRHLNTAEVVQKFRDEAEITSRLDHPGIVSVYGLGKTDKGQPYYVMQRIHGNTLAERVRDFYQSLGGRPMTREQRMRFRQLLTSFVAVCRTMMYAHRRGVVHADIKPKNIVIGKHGETIMLDWGLATPIGKDEHHQNNEEATLRLDESNSKTGSSAGGGGTLGYMSPEQHAGLPVGTASDIYSLGATLYYILTGVAAFDPRQSLPKLRSKIIRGEFEPPRSLNNEVSPQLDSICRKAMALVTTERYKTADELADDIERYFADESVAAHRETGVARGLRWLRHHRDIAWMMIVGASALITGLVIFSTIVTTLAHRQHQASQVAEQARNHSLELVATFASDSVVRRITERWQILEFKSAEDQLVQRLSEIEADAEAVENHWTALSNFLRRTRDNFDQVAGHPDSWFICDATGRQVARIPESDRSIGNRYAHRDYFHGNGRDLPSGKTGEPFHISAPHKSHAYFSSSTGELKIALTVPIWSQREITPDRRFLGIMGMSVSLGEFAELQVNLRKGQNIMIVDASQDYLDDQPERGLVLFHPLMSGKERQDAASQTKPVRIDPMTLKTTLAAVKSHSLIEHFHDPFDDHQREWVAAARPVKIPGTSSDQPSWLVIVAECVDELKAAIDE